MHRSSLVVALAAMLVLSGCASAEPPSDAAPPSAASPSASPRPTPTPTPEPTPEPTVPPAQRILATIADRDVLAVIDPSAAQATLGEVVVGEVVVGTAPWDVEVAPDGATAYVSTAEGLAIVDLTTMQRVALVPYLRQPVAVGFGEYRDGGLGLTVAPDGSRVYVAVHRWPDPAQVEVYDVASGTFVGSAPVGVRPFQLLVAADGSEVYSIDHDTYTVTIVDAATLATREVTIAPFGRGPGFQGWEKLHYGALAPDGTVLLPVQGLALARLDPATGQVTTTPMAANAHSHGTALTADGRLLTSGTGSVGTATGGPNLSILDLATGQERIVQLARPHETVVAWRDAAGAEQAVLSGGFTRDGWWEGLTVVDLATGAVREIPVSGRAQDLEVVG